MMSGAGGVSLPRFSRYSLPLACPEGVPLDRVRAVVDHGGVLNAGMLVCPRTSAETVGSIWKARVAEQPGMFNATKFRYVGVSASPGGVVTFQLEVTDYKTFQATNLADDWEEVLAAHGEGALATTLGNGIFLETIDGMVPCLLRSQDVGEGRGNFCFPGGHPEPSEASLESGGGGGGGGGSGGDQESVRRELFASAAREAVDELGIAAGAIDLADLRLLGVSMREVHHRPTAIFYASTPLTSSEVARAYALKRGLDAFESTNCVLLPADSLSLDVLDARPDRLGHRLSGCHRGGVDLFAQFHAARTRTGNARGH